MLDLKSIRRTQYRSSGNLECGRFVLGALFLIVAASINGAFVVGLYVVGTLTSPLLNMLVPLVVGYGMGWLVYRILIWSQCRNVAIATFVGLICGALIVVTEYQTLRVAVARQAGATLESEAFRLDKLPAYFVRRIQESGNKSAAPTNPATNAVIIRIVFTLLEFSILAGLPIYFARLAAGRAYSETAKCYLSESTVRAVAGSGERLVNALRTGEKLTEEFSVIALCDDVPRPKVPTFLSFKLQKKVAVACTWMRLEYLPANNDEWEAACLSVTEISSSAKQTPLIHQLSLDHTEIPAARRLFVG